MGFCFFFLYLPEDFFFSLLLERETLMWERTSINCLLIHTPTRDQTLNLGMCPDWESNPQPFGLQDDVQLSHTGQGYKYSFIGILSHLIYLHILYGCFCIAGIAVLSSCRRNQMAHKAENIYYLALYRKSLPTLSLNSDLRRVWKRKYSK